MDDNKGIQHENSVASSLLLQTILSFHERSRNTAPGLFHLGKSVAN